MASIYSEYHRFLAYLAQREVHDDVLRLAYLVLNDLQSLAEVGAARRGRSTRLAPLAVEHLAQMPGVSKRAGGGASPRVSAQNAGRTVLRTHEARDQIIHQKLLPRKANIGLLSTLKRHWCPPKAVVRVLLKCGATG